MIDLTGVAGVTHHNVDGHEFHTVADSYGDRVIDGDAWKISWSDPRFTLVHGGSGTYAHTTTYYTPTKGA